MKARFHFTLGRTASNGERYVLFCASYKYQQLRIATGLTTTESNWNGLFKETNPFHIQYNATLRGTIRRAEDYYENCQRKNYPFSLKGLKRVLQGNQDGIMCSEFVETSIYTPNRGVDTLDDMKNSARKFTDWQDIPIAEVNLQIIKDFDKYLHSLNLTLNTIRKIHSHVSAIIGDAVQAELVELNPYSKFKRKSVKRDSKYLSEEDIQKLYDVPPELVPARDQFLFAVYTGLSFSDLAAFSKANVTNVSVDGENMEVIIGKRVKTGEHYTIPLLPIAKAIAEAYDYTMPHKGYSTYRRRLLEIANITGLKSISTHMARHTFATTITYMNDISIENVSAMLGHSDIKTTQVYAKMMEKRLLSQMKKLM